MDPFLMRVFVTEVEAQCAFALRAMGELRQSLAARDTTGVFFYAQGFLGAAGNVSKLLWPPSETIPGRGEKLREFLGISNESPVSPRTFRNHFEHFDERLEQWASTSKRRNLVDSSFLTPGAIKGIDPEDFLRNLNPGTLTLTFRGDTYELTTVEAALREIHRVAERKRFEY
jgi:hypothetical protein